METQIVVDALAKHKVALCLGCNYSLHHLTVDRCPECGRSFDRNDPGTFNTARPLTWLDRQLLKPIGWPTFSALGIACAGYLYLALAPGFYYMMAHVFVGMLLLAGIGALLFVRLALRGLVPRSIDRPSSKRRYRALLSIFGVTFLLVLLHVPLRALFLLARPSLNDTVRRINDGTLKTPLVSHRAGIFVISTSPWYGHDGQLFFVVEGLGGGGFAYNPSREALSYNAGADGPLGGDWYWWVDD
jgi:hypothetical protein